MHIAIVSNLRDGKGLYRDALILERILDGWGHEVALHDFRGLDRRARYHLVIHLEMVTRPALWWSENQWWFVNPDWAGKEHLEFSDAFRFILAKTWEGERVLRQAGLKRVVMTGFESELRYDEGVKKERRFFHVWGGSMAKGTRSVLRAWEKLDFPSTFIVSEKMADPQFRREQNRCAFWLQPSSVEGFGHVIHEGLGCGAVIATTDGPPMNESPGVPFRIPAKRIARQNLADIWDVSPAAIVETVRAMWDLSDGELERLSSSARWYARQESASFRTALKQLL